MEECGKMMIIIHWQNINLNHNKKLLCQAYAFKPSTLLHKEILSQKTKRESLLHVYQNW